MSDEDPQFPDYRAQEQNEEQERLESGVNLSQENLSKEKISQEEEN